VGNVGASLEVFATKWMHGSNTWTTGKLITDVSTNPNDVRTERFPA
jgi:hypothetical protein